MKSITFPHASRRLMDVSTSIKQKGVMRSWHGLKSQESVLFLTSSCVCSSHLFHVCVTRGLTWIRPGEWCQKYKKYSYIIHLLKVNMSYSCHNTRVFCVVARLFWLVAKVLLGCSVWLPRCCPVVAMVYSVIVFKNS